MCERVIVGHECNEKGEGVNEPEKVCVCVGGGVRERERVGESRCTCHLLQVTTTLFENLTRLVDNREHNSMQMSCRFAWQSSTFHYFSTYHNFLLTLCA